MNSCDCGSIAVKNTYVAWESCARYFLKYVSYTVISQTFQFKQRLYIAVVTFRAAGDKEMAGSRYDSDFLSVSASWGHPSYLYHKGVCCPRHADDSGRAQSHKPTLRPSHFLSSLMPHTLSLFIGLHPSRKHTQKMQMEKERERICTSGQGFVEKVQPQRKPSDRQDGDRGAATRHHTPEFSVSGALRALEKRDTPTLHDQCTIRRPCRGSHQLQDESVMFCCLCDIQCSWHLPVRMAKSHPLALRITLLFASRKRMLSTCNG